MSTDQRWRSDDEKTARYFDALVREHGADPRSVDWGSAASQGRRFEVLAAIGALDGTRILDVGCGTGDLLQWLLSRNLSVTYTGVDITPGMIDVAATRFPDASFHVGSVLEWSPPAEQRFDWVFASGIFYLRQERPTEYLNAAVARMYALAERGIAFNSLSAWADVVDDGEFHADPLATLAMCRALSPRLALRHDYHPRDFAIYVYRPQ
jgi:SAM-dependent methyltransferase